MKKINGVCLPDYERHLVDFVTLGRAYKGRGTYQLRKLERALEFTKQFRHAVDIGAHVGLWSWVLADKFERVTCFEPAPEHVECFHANMAGCSNVALHEVALGSENGSLQMISPNDNSGNTRAIAKVGPPEPHDFTALMMPLDAFNLQDVDLMKIDVEGFELEVLRGGIETIKRCKPVIVIEQKGGNAELQGVHRYAALDVLSRLGMKEVDKISGDHILAW